MLKPAHQATQFTPILSPLPSLTFYGPRPPAPNFASFCVTRISSPKRCKKIEGVVLNRACIKGFFVLNRVRFQTSAADLYPNIGRVEYSPPPPLPFLDHFGNREALGKSRNPWNQKDHVTAVCWFIEGKEITTGHDKKTGSHLFLQLGKSFCHFLF